MEHLALVGGRVDAPVEQRVQLAGGVQRGLAGAPAREVHGAGALEQVLDVEGGDDHGQVSGSSLQLSALLDKI